MIKKIILILCLSIAIPSYGEAVLTGGVFYNVNSAREELLHTPIKKLNPFFTAQHITDKNNTENLKYFLRGNVELKDRTLAFFSNSTYAVMYNEDKYHVWYYTNSGKLIYTEVKDGLNYPYKSYKFNTAGKLINMGLRISKGETFIYSPNGKLIAHWLGQYAYDEKGNIIMSRKYSD